MKTNRDSSSLARTRFSALGAGYMNLFWFLIGSQVCLYVSVVIGISTRLFLTHAMGAYSRGSDYYFLSVFKLRVEAHRPITPLRTVSFSYFILAGSSNSQFIYIFHRSNFV